MKYKLVFATTVLTLLISAIGFNQNARGQQSDQSTSLTSHEASKIQPNIPWLGLTPLALPTTISPAESAKYQKAEEQLKLGRIGFWSGIAGFAASILSDRVGFIYGRTLGYSIVGAGWLTWIGSYGVAQQSLSMDSAKNSSHKRARFSRASTQGAIGEASNLFLIPGGAYIHPIYNDVNGGTDKLLTASAKLGLLQDYESMGWESIAYWRLLTPSFQHEFGQPDAPQAVGRYADWREWKSSVAGLDELNGWTLRHQISVGFNDVGPHGGKELHQKFHKLTNNSVEHLEYVNQPEGTFTSFAEELGIVSDLCLQNIPCIDQLTSLEASQSKFMNEFGLKINLVWTKTPEWWENAAEVRILRQISSQVYSDFRPWRFELAIGARVLKVLTPTVKYVSPYLWGDDIGQTYFDLLHYNIEF